MWSTRGAVGWLVSKTPKVNLRIQASKPVFGKHSNLVSARRFGDIESTRLLIRKTTKDDTVDGRDSAPVDMVNIPLFT